MRLPDFSLMPGARTTLPLLHDSADALALATLLRNSGPMLILSAHVCPSHPIHGFELSCNRGDSDG